jgi:hypothetical protein
MLLLSACGGEQMAIKSIPAPVSAVAKPVPARIAEARGFLVTGNVGLAIESFRKAQRDDPTSADALTGLAQCYEQMGRYELARRYHEEALALAPKDPVLLTGLARSLDEQGLKADAAAVRKEAVALVRTPVAAVAKPLPARPVAAPAPVMAPSQRLALASASPPKPAPAAPQPVKVVVPAAKPASAPPQAPKPVVAEAEPVAAPRPVLAETKATPTPKPLVTEAKPAPTPEPVLAAGIGSVTMTLPPLLAPVNKKAPQAPRPALPEPIRVAALPADRPRLERLSLVEVALVTRSVPMWQPLIADRQRTSTTVRWVPLRQTQQVASIRLLNAARHEGLAARTRVALARNGWKQVSIGDASKVRERSLILYSEASAPVARKLAAKFGFMIAREARPGPITILLGRDAVGVRQARG